MLSGWKEIAHYLGRGVRTVQRWELDAALPVHRPKGQPRSAVFARRIEIDEWATAAPVRNGDSIPELRARISELLAENESLRQRLAEHDLEERRERERERERVPARHKAAS